MSASTSGARDRYPSINIIGAGIAGLSVACQLRKRRIPFNIFDAASQPKGHHYGITISSWGYHDVLPTLAAESKVNLQNFRELTAVDRLVGGTGRLNPDKDGDSFRASDMALREVLARGHQVNWNHKLIAAKRTPDGLRLSFENGKESTADLVIDAGGERSGLLSLLLPDLKPEILPYAVYHGSRYLSHSTFAKSHSDIFENGQTVRSFPPQGHSTNTWSLQIARAYINRSQVSSKAHVDDDGNSTDAKDPIVEFRYTFSRPASDSSTTNPDPLYNPNRTPSAAKTVPEHFFTELSTYLSEFSSNLPSSLTTLLSPAKIQKHDDRILNWLMRVKPLAQPDHHQDLRTLAEHAVIAVGDAVHSTPPVASEGATLAMADAASVAEWIEKVCRRGSEEDTNQAMTEEKIWDFYEGKLPQWAEALDGAKRRLQELHHPDTDADKKLSGRI